MNRRIDIGSNTRDALPVRRAAAGDVFGDAFLSVALRVGMLWLDAQLDRLKTSNDRLYIHIEMDVLDPREVMAHGNKVPGGPSSEELAALFDEIFRRYPKASAIGFATIPPRDEGGLSIVARGLAGWSRWVYSPTGVWSHHVRSAPRSGAAPACQSGLPEWPANLS